jgi:hypothetical protein
MADDPRIEFAPDPIVRQSDLKLLEQREKTQHTRTRAMIVILAAADLAKVAPFVLGYLGWFH